MDKRIIIIIKIFLELIVIGLEQLNLLGDRGESIDISKILKMTEKDLKIELGFGKSRFGIIYN